MTSAGLSATLRWSGEAIHGSSERLRIILEQLALGREVPRADIDGAIDQLVGAGQRLREALADAARHSAGHEAEPSWTTPEEMRAALERLAGQLEVAGRLEALLHELDAGRIVERVEARRRRLEGLRAAARDALTAAQPAQAGAFPWPPEHRDSWVRWLLALEDPDASAALDAIGTVVPAVSDLLTVLSAAQWEYARPQDSPAGGAAAEHGGGAAHAPAAAPGHDAPPPGDGGSAGHEHAGNHAGAGNGADGPTGASLASDAVVAPFGHDDGRIATPPVEEPSAESWVAQWRRSHLPR